MPHKEDADDLFSWSRCATRYARTSTTLTRWMKDPKIRFPEPDIYIAQRPFWRRSSLDKFDARMAREGERSTQAPPTRAA